MKVSRIAAAALVLASAAACGTPVVGVPVPVAGTSPSPVTSTATVVAPVPETLYVQPPVSVAPAETAEGRTVIAYYDALNRRDFATAWTLGGKRLAGDGRYDKYVSGFATTSWDTLTVTDVRGSTVSVALSALQTDGSVRTFTGTYTVLGGEIVGSHMTRTN